MEEDRDFDRFIELFKFGNPADIWRYGTTTKNYMSLKVFKTMDLSAETKKWRCCFLSISLA
jgi:hypothetical protein